MNKISSFGLLFVLCLCIFLVTVTGCGNAAEDLAENMIESGNGDVDVDIDSDNGHIKIQSDEGNVNIDVNSDDGEVSIDSDEGSYHMTSGDSADWPEDLPNFVPQLDGDIIQVMEMDIDGGKQYTIAYENLDDIDMESYVEELEDNGWEIESQMDFNDTWMVQASCDDDAWYITAGVNTEDATGTLSIMQEE